MFEQEQTPRLFGIPPGVDFPQALVDGLLARLKGQPPEALARVELFVNTARMQRRIRQLFAERGASLLPRIRLVTELANDVSFDIPPAIDGLGRKLDLAQLVRKLIEAEPDLAAKDAAFDLADSLVSLLEEMQGEAVALDAITALDVGEHSEHWKRSQKFIALVHHYLDADVESDTEGRQRAVVNALENRWQTTPPDHPIIVAGSTGSRGTTRAFMRAVSKLPQGALILPGFDFDMPPQIWDMLETRAPAEDHPQYRYYRLMKELELNPADIRLWGDPPDQAITARNKLVSLAMRPAPVTDAWLEEGPKLKDLPDATRALTLVEAPTQRVETLAIALRLRKAIEDEMTAALITPDQTLARRVTAALSAWHIVPNDSAGARLDLSPPGRLLRQTARLIGHPISPDSLLALLKQPLVCAGDRRTHLFKTRHLEMQLLRGGPPALTQALTRNWAENREADDPGTLEWHDWLWSCLEPLSTQGRQDLTKLVETHRQQSERLTQGPSGSSSHLWLKTAGEKAHATFENLWQASPVAGAYTPAEYSDLIDALLAKEEVRDPYFSHPDIMIWGTLEARVQGAGLVILAGLNDGSWPDMPEPDPWLNRDMRHKAGLRLPESRIGLSAHDFQQAIAAPEVWLTRAVRDEEAETVPSRWLNRIQNLMTGLDDNGKAAFEGMQHRGREWVELAQNYDVPRLHLGKAPRPAPQPPADVRPKRLSVTHIETLIRDPYAIYARHVLKLRPLKPLHAEADAALRGDVIHKILQAFIAKHKGPLPKDAEEQLLAMAQDFFERHISWPATRALWMARFARSVPWFVQTEAARRAFASPEVLEADGTRSIHSMDFKLHGRADRIDRDEAGALVLYDYKTGQLPTEKVQKHFNKQLPLLAAIGDAGGFEGYNTANVKSVSYIGLGADPKEVQQSFEAGETDRIWAELETLISEYMDPDKGFASRRAVFEERWDQDYDTLARYGEWDRTDPVKPIRVGT